MRRYAEIKSRNKIEWSDKEFFIPDVYYREMQRLKFGLFSFDSDKTNYFDIAEEGFLAWTQKYASDSARCLKTKNLNKGPKFIGSIFVYEARCLVSIRLLEIEDLTC